LLLGQWSRPLAIWERFLGPRDTFLLNRSPRHPEAPEQSASRAANLAVRLLQVHVALIVVVSGLHKLQMAPWWSGVAFWYPLHPPFETGINRIRSEAPNATETLIWLGLAQYLVLAWQIGFPLFAWRKGYWRLVLLGGGVAGWIGSVFIFKQPLFGPVYLIGCLSYLTPAEWLWVPEKLASRAREWTASPTAIPNKARVRTRV
jgi:hypothetical protein